MSDGSRNKNRFDDGVQPDYSGASITTVRAVDEARQRSDNLIRLSTGVVLRAKQAPPLTLIEVMASHKRPEPPIQFIKVLGRNQPNYDDPDYIKRAREFEMEYNHALLTAMIALGTEFVSCPEGVPAPHDDAWLADYRILGLPMELDSKAWRYVTWVRFKAALSDVDTKAIMEAVGRLSGTAEADVREAERFPGSE